MRLVVHNMKLVAVILCFIAAFCASNAHGDYDFSKLRSLPGLSRKATSIGLRIASNAAAICKKILLLSVNSNVKSFTEFLKTKAPSLPKLEKVEFAFDDQSTLFMDDGRVLLSEDFNVKTVMSGNFLNIQWSWSPVKITYGNVTYADPHGVVSHGKVFARVNKMAVSADLALQLTDCPIKLMSLSTHSIRNVRSSSNWSTPVESEHVERFLNDLPSKWEKSLPKALLDNLRASAFVRGIADCNESDPEAVEGTVLDQLKKVIWHHPRLFEDFIDRYIGKY